MLSEITAARKDGSNASRRWFQDDYFDLFVWTDAKGEINSFQLAYSRTHNEHVLSWKNDQGYQHARIDERRTDDPVLRGTEFMVPSGTFPSYSVAPRFERAAAELDASIRDFVLTKLREYPRALHGPMRKPRRKKGATRTAGR